MKKDYYLILRVTPEATAGEIRSAYRRRAIELHPDVSGFSSDQFLELHEAYSVLSDPMQRAVYDQEAQEIPVRHIDVARPTETMFTRRHSPEPLTPVQPSYLRSWETFLPSFNEMFGPLWSNFESATRLGPERPESLIVDVPLSSREAFMGGQMRILVPLRTICPACHGRGHLGPYQCSHCEGLGALRNEYPVTVSYPPGLQKEYVVRLLMDACGGENFYLVVRFRPGEPIW
ncbi:MAG: J domain-containing protein [Verrucomicrobia bacterium]|nr:J domain-containing protein [Verrucomicrobiota bacterium]